jgi:hypothetical protein
MTQKVNRLCLLLHEIKDAGGIKMLSEESGMAAGTSGAAAEDISQSDNEQELPEDELFLLSFTPEAARRRTQALIATVALALGSFFIVRYLSDYFMAVYGRRIPYYQRARSSSNTGVAAGTSANGSN